MSLNKNKLINIIFPDQTKANDNKSIAKIYSSFLCLRRKNVSKENASLELFRSDLEKRKNKLLLQTAKNKIEW